MLYDLVIPEDPGEILDVKCLVVAAFYDENECRSFGIAEDNTEIELKKLNYTLQQLQTDGIDTREGLENQLI